MVRNSRGPLDHPQAPTLITMDSEAETNGAADLLIQ